MINSIGKTTCFQAYQKNSTLNINKMKPINNSTGIDTVSLSPESRQTALIQTAISQAANVETQNSLVRAPQNYPKGFPEDARKELDVMAKDPAISDKEYMTITAFTVILPQYSFNHANSEFTRNEKIFMNKEFSLGKHIQQTLDNDLKYGGSFSEEIRQALQRFV